MLSSVLGALTGAVILAAGFWIGRRYALPLVVDVRTEELPGVLPEVANKGRGRSRRGVDPDDDQELDPVVALSDVELAELEADEDDQPDEREPTPGRPYLGETDE